MMKLLIIVNSIVLDIAVDNIIIRSCSMDATAKMKNGESWDLLSDLAQHPEFGMSRQEMEAALDPMHYIGRCPEQVDAFLAEVRPLIADIAKSDAQINL